ncbi:hypothetical protein GW17_00060717 [Ensete ventricosum]|nr:hypothetical protein GW17_00060717 [Ensete ventricosum]
MNPVCLDGSLPGYHLHRGYGSGANSWVVNLEAAGLYFRGQRIWLAAMEELMSIGMRYANQVSFALVWFIKLLLFSAMLLAMQRIATDVGDWFFDRGQVDAVDCAYPCDNTCHHIVFRGTH